MKFNKILLITFLTLTSSNSLAKEITVSGTIFNNDQKKSLPNVVVYLPGEPIVTGSAMDWAILAKTQYDDVNNTYEVEVIVPDDYQEELVIGVSYLDVAKGDGVLAYVSSPVVIGDKLSVIQNLTIPVFPDDTQSVQIKLKYESLEHDYSRPYSCMIVKNDNARIIFLAYYDYILNKNKLKNLPDGDYRVACVMKNLYTSSPDVIRKVFNLSLPLMDEDGNPLSEDRRVFDLRFDPAGDGVSF